jgi:transcription elongation factor Elf1
MNQPDKLDYRLDYSPKCIHCNHYCYELDDCDLQTEDDPYLEHPACNQFSQRTDDYCDSCGKPYQENIDEDITESDGYEEFWGARVSRPDVLVGFVCNDCGETNLF